MLDPDRILVLLRGASRLVLLDGSGTVASSIPAPPGASGWSFLSAGRVAIAGEFSDTVAVVDVWGRELTRVGSLPVASSTGVRDLAWDAGSATLYAAEAGRPRLHALRLAGPDGSAGPEVLTAEIRYLDAPAVELKTVGSWLLVNELLAHRLRILRLESGAAEPEIILDGPIWSFDASATETGLTVALGAVEDHPLDRSGGEFGFVDSFLYLYEVESSTAPRRLAELNLSAEGVITPKSLHIEGGTLTIGAYGSERLLQLNMEAAEIEVLRSVALPAGTADIARSSDGALYLANPLTDRVFVVESDADGGVGDFASFAAGDRSAGSRLGEALFFTALMAPANVSTGHHSRFTCETCHFEGEIDGRTHYTGRGSVFATTKTLRGLADNVPVFSRGSDATLASMVVAEFEVANQAEPGFTLEPDRHPTLGALGYDRTVGPSEQREALLRFLIEFGHRPLPLSARGTDLAPLEREGLAVFRDRCSACHQPLTSTRESGRFVPFDEWEAWIEDPDADLVWGAPLFFKTGIEPYVSERGARAPSLRRVSRKFPLFTNGAAAGLEAVLQKYRATGPAGMHETAAVLPHEDGRPLTDSETAALLALLDRF